MSLNPLRPEGTLSHYYYESSFLIVLHNVWSTGPGKAADLSFELEFRKKLNLKMHTNPVISVTFMLS